MDWFSTENDLLWYVGIIVAFLAFFVWNSLRLKKNRSKQKERNFKKRYMERKKEHRTSEDD